MSAIIVDELTRVYRTDRRARPITALDSVSLEVGEGEVFGLLGPNGAGKSTLVKILATVLLPTSGSASVLGNDVVRAVAKVRRSIGTVFGGEHGLYRHLTGRQNLEYWAALYQVPESAVGHRIAELLELVGLAERGDDLVEGYSRGMKQRLHLARGLIGEASVLFLDEPTIGMDPVAAREFRNVVVDLSAKGRTILITTHDMAEAEALCGRVALIDRGRLIATETPASLARAVGTTVRIEFRSPAEGLIPVLEALDGIISIRPLLATERYRIEVRDDVASLVVLQQLISAGVTEIATTRPSLTDVYFHFVGKQLPADGIPTP